MLPSSNQFFDKRTRFEIQILILKIKLKISNKSKQNLYFIFVPTRKNRKKYVIDILLNQKPFCVFLFNSIVKETFP